MPRSAVPPYRRIAAAIRDVIREGRLLPGEQLPTIPELMEAHSVGRNTVLRALGILREERRVQGWGSFVADELPPKVIDREPG